MRQPKSTTAAVFLLTIAACFLLVLSSIAGKFRDGTAYLYYPPLENLSYMELVNWFKTTCQTFCTTELPGQVRIKEANAAVNRLAGKWIFESTEVIRLKNGYLNNANRVQYDHDALQEQLTSFRDFAADRLGAPYLYIQAPCKLCAYDDQLPIPGLSNENDQTSQLLEWMDGWGVDTLDLRESLHRDGLDHYSSFYVTDHHWTLETGLWAARCIAADLNRRYGLHLDTDALSEDGFTRQTWEGVFLGSWGRKVTRVFAEPEDFCLPVPQAQLHMKLTRYGTEYTGGFDALYDESWIVPEDLYTGNSYGAMLRGDCGYIKVENLDNPDGPVIALLRESFAGAAGPYLAMTAGELHLIDARYYEDSVFSLLEEIQPDVVLSLLNTQCHTGAYFDEVS